MKVRLIVISALVISSLLLVGCGGDAPERAERESLRARVVLPEELRSAIAASDAAVTMVHIWATWCPPCVEEFPEIVALQNFASVGDLDFILLSADNPSDLDSVDNFLAEHESPWPSLVAERLDEDLMSVFGPEWSGAIPATFFFGRDGQLLKWWTGAHSKEEYELAIAELLPSVQNGK